MISLLPFHLHNTWLFICPSISTHTVKSTWTMPTEAVFTNAKVWTFWSYFIHPSLASRKYAILFLTASQGNSLSELIAPTVIPLSHQHSLQCYHQKKKCYKCHNRYKWYNCYKCHNRSLREWNSICEKARRSASIFREDMLSLCEQSRDNFPNNEKQCF